MTQLRDRTTRRLMRRCDAVDSELQMIERHTATKRTNSNEKRKYPLSFSLRRGDSRQRSRQSSFSCVTHRTSADVNAFGRTFREKRGGPPSADNDNKSFKLLWTMTTRLFLRFLALALGVAAFRGNLSRPRFSSTAALAKRERRTPRAPPSAGRRERAPAVIKRAPHQFDHTQEEARPFIADPMEAIKAQDPNEDAEPYDLHRSDDSAQERQLITHPHVATYSLDELFPGLSFSEIFNTSPDFRNELRDTMREDIFDTTPAYHGMSEKARKFLLLPDSSLQGSWKCQNGGWSRAQGDEKDGPRMQRLSKVLQAHLGDGAPMGDDFMDTIGKLSSVHRRPAMDFRRYIQTIFMPATGPLCLMRSVSGNTAVAPGEIRECSFPTHKTPAVIFQRQAIHDTTFPTSRENTPSHLLCDQRIPRACEGTQGSVLNCTGAMLLGPSR
eukprot:scaffold2120_cov169-Amphora_coffeaeformis.AAC.14